MFSGWPLPVCTLAMLSTVWSPLGAVERHFSGARAVGMGGSAVAAAEPDQAQAYNPAVLGFMDSERDGDDGSLTDHEWRSFYRRDAAFDLNLGLQARGDLQHVIEALQAIDRALLTSLSDLDPDTIRSWFGTVARLGTLETDKLSISVDANAGLGGRWNNWALGARLHIDGSGFVTDADLRNIALNGIASLATELVDNADQILGMDPDDYTIQQLTAEQTMALSGSYTEEAVKVLDKLLSEVSGLEGYDDQVQQDLVDALEDLTETPATDLGNNETRVTLGTLWVLEIPVSYGYAFNDNFAIGGSVKLMYGTSTGISVRVFDRDAEDIIYKREGKSKESWNVGVDLSAAYRWQWLRLGLLGRNLNEPSFEGHGGLGGRKTTIDRNVIASLAVQPVQWLTTSLDVDLLEYRRIDSRIDMQNLNLGLEIQPVSWCSLRAGAWTNIASNNFDDDTAVSLGLGLGTQRWWVDFAVASGVETVTYDKWTLPKQLRLSLDTGYSW